MKKLINKPGDVVKEALEGLALAWPDLLQVHLDPHFSPALRPEKAYLTQLDAAIGDADHGANMDRGFQAVAGKLAGVGQGHEIEVRASGPDAEEAISALRILVVSGIDESGN